MDWIIALDRSIIFSVQDMVVTPWLTPLMRFISFIGEYAGLLVLLPMRHYITYYNKQRIKSKLGWLSPVDYRLRHAAA